MKIRFLRTRWQAIKQTFRKQISLWQQDIYFARIGAFSSRQSLSGTKSRIPSVELIPLRLMTGPVPYSRSISCFNSQLG